MKLASFLTGLKTKDLLSKATTYSDPNWRNKSHLVILRKEGDLAVPPLVATGVPVSTDVLHIYCLLRGLGDEKATSQELTELMNKLSGGKWESAAPLIELYLQSLEVLMLAASQKADPKSESPEKQRVFHVIAHNPAAKPTLAYSARSSFESFYTVHEQKDIAPTGYAMSSSMYQHFLKSQIVATPQQDNMAM